MSVKKMSADRLSHVFNQDHAAKWKLYKNEGWTINHRGALQFICCVLVPYQKRTISNSAGGTILVNMLLQVLQLLFLSDTKLVFHVKPNQCWRCWCQENSRLFTWMKPLTKDTTALCKQISLSSRPRGLKIPQTGYEAAAEAGELRRQTRGCAGSMPLWHVNGEGRGETRSGCVCVLEGGHFFLVGIWLTKG